MFSEGVINITINLNNVNSKDVIKNIFSTNLKKMIEDYFEKKFQNFNDWNSGLNRLYFLIDLCEKYPNDIKLYEGGASYASVFKYKKVKIEFYKIWREVENDHKLF